MIWSFLLSSFTFANQVRTIAVNNEAMATIFLKMGKSTVLRFIEKPKKVVVGNQNYYGLEFIENDLAIQPLGAVATNLFVYTENHTYGFLLTPGEKYDDLVFVHWKQSKVCVPEKLKPVSFQSSSSALMFKVGNGIKIVITKVQAPSTFGLNILDCWIENVGRAGLDISTIIFQATRAGRPLNDQKFVTERDNLKVGEKARVRILFRSEKQENFTLESRLGKEIGKVRISRKFL